MESQDVRIVEGWDTSQKWDCKNNVFKFGLSYETVSYEDSFQNRNPLGNIDVSKSA